MNIFIFLKRVRGNMCWETHKVLKRGRSYVQRHKRQETGAQDLEFLGVSQRDLLWLGDMGALILT